MIESDMFGSSSWAIGRYTSDDRAHRHRGGSYAGCEARAEPVISALSTYTSPEETWLVQVT